MGISGKFVTVLVSSLVLSGCSLLKASPAKDAGFLPKAELLSEQRERAPFNGYWVFDPNEYHRVRKRYRRVYIAPVDTSIVAKMYRSASGKEKTKQHRIQEAEELASYFQHKIRLALEGVESKFRVVEQPGPQTLTVRLSLVEVVPTNPGINLIGTAAGFFVPGGGLIKVAGEGSVAMEGFVSELTPENLFEQYKDREGQKISPFTLKDYQRYAHIRGIIDEWAMQIVALLTTPPDVAVEDSALVSLSPV